MSDLDRILHLAGVKLTETRVDELYGSKSDAEFMGRLGNDPTKKPADHQKKMKKGNFWKGVKPKEIEDEEDELMHEYEEFMNETDQNMNRHLAKIDEAIASLKLFKETHDTGEINTAYELIKDVKQNLNLE